MGVLLVSRVTARFLRKFERSCRRGTSRQRVQKARPTSTLIRRCSLRVRTRLFPYLSFSLSLSSSLLARVIFLLHPTFCISDAVPGHGCHASGKFFFFSFVRPRSFSFFDSSCDLPGITGSVKFVVQSCRCKKNEFRTILLQFNIARLILLLNIK